MAIQYGLIDLSWEVTVAESLRNHCLDIIQAWYWVTQILL